MSSGKPIPKLTIMLPALAEQADAGNILQLAAGDVLFAQGDMGDCMYFVLHGTILIKADDHIIDRLSPGDFFGEMSLVDQQPRSAAAEAGEASRVLRVDAAQFAELVRQAPDFALSTMTSMSTRLRRLMVEEVKRQRMEEELRISHEIQLSLLPRAVPEIPGWDIAAHYRPARLVSGDFYDFVRPQDSEHLDLVIGDVTGKGVPAALFMAASRTMLHVLGRQGKGPAITLTDANTGLVDDRRLRIFLSCFYASLDTKNGQLRFANAGHDLPFWWQAETRELSTLRAAGFVLGAFRNIKLAEQAVFLAPGDCVVFFTDGVTEARNPAGGFFGSERFEAIVKAQASVSAAAVIEATLAAVDAFCAGRPAADDLTLLVLRRLPESV